MILSAVWLSPCCQIEPQSVQIKGKPENLNFLHISKLFWFRACGRKSTTNGPEQKFIAPKNHYSILLCTLLLHSTVQYRKTLFSSLCITVEDLNHRSYLAMGEVYREWPKRWEMQPHLFLFIFMLKGSSNKWQTFVTINLPAMPFQMLSSSSNWLILM